MALSAILLALILAIGYFQSIHGLFSALINCVLAVLCAALSFATHEYIAVNLLAQFKPDFALGLALIGMFIIPMAILRALLDALVHRACLLPMIVDKAGGFVFGIIGAYIMVGMLALGLQMIPFGNGFLGFTRVDPENPKEQNELWLTPDRFAVGVGSLLSGGVLSGDRSFSELHPDLVTEIGWREAVPFDGDTDRRGVRRFAPPNSISSEGYEIVDYVYKKTPPQGATPAQYEPRSPDGGKKFVKVRFRVDSAAADGDSQHRFTPFQIRLVGTRGEDVEQYHAIAIADSDQPEKPVEGFPGNSGKTEYIVKRLLAPDPQMNIIAVFEAPERFTPGFVEYKGGARAELRESKPRPEEAQAAAPPTPEQPETPSPAPSPEPPRRTGVERVGGVRVAGSFFGDNLPVTMTDYIGSDTEIDNGKEALKQGHLRGNFADQGAKATHPPVAKFEVPENKRLLHLNTENLRARSTLGRALSFAVKTLQNYVVHDDAGREYKAVGVYAIANVDGAEQVEVIYFPEYVEMSSRGLPTFSKIKDSHLQGSDYTYVFLYLIEPGAKLLRFTTGARASQAIDLREFNLVAPP